MRAGPGATAPRRRRRPSPRHLAAVAAVWVAVVGAALLTARALDAPVAAGARDAAQPAVPDAVAGGTGERPVGTLPPFAMVLDRPLPPGVAGLDPAAQAGELRARAARTRDPDRLVELGAVMQTLGDAGSAASAYRSAFAIAPGALAPRVGLAVVDGHEGQEALARGAGRLAALVADHPRDQLVAFNRAWVEIYRERRAAARALLRRSRALGAGTRLGRTSGALLVALDTTRLRPGP
ncbi:hypothetical protein [Miltoncostaea marina]|uniref:hypothetical protein n=1 Tax=Miltoncostaea marina TaxID=2843215 RepID=UPI001C3C4F4C|nr:hypothetical protein [Miltoncostaea marina]